MYDCHRYPSPVLPVPLVELSFDALKPDQVKSLTQAIDLSNLTPAQKDQLKELVGESSAPKDAVTITACDGTPLCKAFKAGP